MEHFTCIVPARNEESRITEVLDTLRDLPAEIIVVDNGSTDATAEIASHSGARVVYEPRVGKGHAVLAGAQTAETERIFLCDADIHGLDVADVVTLLDLTHKLEPLSRLSIERAPEAAPVTCFVAGPLMRALGFPDLAEPLGGLAAIRKSFLLEKHLPGGWGFDVALTIAAVETAGTIRELKASGITHRVKPLTDYIAMAEDVLTSILRCRAILPWDHADCTRCIR